ncbi:MAG TPA: TerC family protein [Actinomycetota bacterium]|nr:TerC family protein [Actinomycetota bacterium]
MDVSPWLYVGFIGFVIAMLLIDLKLFHTEVHTPTTKESGIWVAIWVSLALAFGIGLLVFQGSKDAGEYFAGYLIEYSLSVDNMFVFVVIFSYFKIPLSHQHQVLFYGILGAMVFRGIFIALGTALVQNFDWVIPIFGIFLLYTAYKIAKGSAEHVHPEDNPVLKFARKRLRTTTKLEGQKLFTMENGKRVATPLFIVLLFIETTDIFFAIDSIPAIFAVTKEPFIVLTSNVFAILGLRALYFLLAGGMDRLHLLKYGLAVILGFVGVKMLLEGTELVGLTEHAIHVPIWLSLTVIIGVLTITAILSFKIPPKEQADIEHRLSGDDETNIPT